MIPCSGAGHSHIVGHDGKVWAVVLHGRGRVVFQSAQGGEHGAVAEGPFRHDDLHGHGEYVYENGIRYVGNMRRWEASGAGAVRFADGRELCGEFERDCPVEGTLARPDGSRCRVKYDGRTSIDEARRRRRRRAGHARDDGCVGAWARGAWARGHVGVWALRARA